MLDPRLYRVAFVPVLLALLVAAFSLQDRPRAIGTTQPPDSFDGIRAQDTLNELAGKFPDRRPGSPGDEALAQRIATTFRQTVPGGTVELHRYRGDTIDGKRDLVDVIATRPGAPGPPLVVVAHRDAAERGSKAELSATAALLELARVAADGRLRRTITFISTTGGSGGYAGAREEARRLGGRPDAILVLGDVAADPGRRPFVVGYGDGRGQAPLQLRRTVESAVRKEVGGDVGAPHVFAQWARIAAPVTLSEQGPFLRAGLPAVLLAAGGERPPAADAPVHDGRMTRFGRAALRTLYALDNFPRDLAQAPRDDLVVRGKVMPEWAVRLLVGTLLLPPLLAAVDAFARLRRRHQRFTVWAVWTLASGIPFLLACLFAVLLALVGLIRVAPPAPIPGPALELGGSTIAAGIALVLVFVLGWLLVRPALLHAIGVRGAPESPGAAVAVALVTSAVAYGIWIGNPYAAGLIVPAVHLWLWATIPDLRVPRAAAFVVVLAGVLPVALVALIDLRAFGMGLGQFGWFWTLLVAGSHIPSGSWVLWSLLWGCGVAAALVVLRRPPREDAPEDVTVRGPVSYAGPGSLGGTESALRR